MPSPLCLNTHSTLNTPRIKSCCKIYSDIYSDTKLFVNCKHTWRLSLEEIINLSTTTCQRKTATEGKAGCKCHNTVRWGRLIGKVSVCETVNPWERCLPRTSQKHKCIFESTNPYTASTCSSNPKQSLDKACASCQTTIICSCKHPFVRQTRYSLHPCLPDPYWEADRNHKVCDVIRLLNTVMAIWHTGLLLSPESWLKNNQIGLSRILKAQWVIF